jgi:hypothetical protein
MNASEINSVMKDFANFKGTFSFDKAPKLKHFEFLILNSATAEKQFGHWVRNNLN